MRFSNPIFAQELHVEDVEHELGPRGRLGSPPIEEEFKNSKIPNRRELRIAPGRLSGRDEGGAPAKINSQLERDWLYLFWDPSGSC